MFRATHLDGQTFFPGEQFYFDLNLFDTASQLDAGNARRCPEGTHLAIARPSEPGTFWLPRSPTPDYLALTFAQLARQGLGPGRRKVELISVASTPVTLELSPLPEKISRVTVRFLTPTELKSGQQLAPRPDFAILATRARDRISTLRELYGPGPLEIDFKAFGVRAAEVRMTRCEIQTVTNQRYSSRTGQTHPLGGFVGEADYQGALSEFVPYLRASEWTGAGRQTVWGKGLIKVEYEPD